MDQDEVGRAVLIGTLDERNQKQRRIAVPFSIPLPRPLPPALKTLSVLRSCIHSAIALFYPTLHQSSPGTLRRVLIPTHYLYHQLKSSGGAFKGVAAAGGGLFVKTLARTAVNTPNVLSHYSGSKCEYGMNVQATCDSNYHFCSMSCIAPGATNDWTAWNRSDVSKAVEQLPAGFYMLGDAAYL